MTELEDRSCRNNLQIDGVAEEQGETWEMYEAKAKQVFKQNLCIQKDIFIERAHRTKSRNNNDKNVGGNIAKNNDFKASQLQR